MGNNIDLVKLFAFPKDTTCINCGKITKTGFNSYDIETPDSFDNANFDLTMYCVECDTAFKFKGYLKGEGDFYAI